MSPLHADPNELRAESRLPVALRNAARPCNELEKRTGADLLVSPLLLPVTSDELLRRHCKAGILIQRKSGLDLASSITDGRLDRDLVRMLAWTDRPWLVVEGTIENRGGQGYIWGRKSLSYPAFMGALDWWQIRGGYVTQLDGDGALINWVNSWPRKLEVIESNAVKVVHRSVMQEMFKDPKTGVLLALPGLGQERATALLSAASGNLSKALEIITGSSRYIPGIGPETRKAVREWLSMGESERLAVIDEKLLALGVQGCLELTGREEGYVVKVAGALHSVAMHLAGMWDKGYRTECWEAWFEDWCNDPLRGLSIPNDAENELAPI